MDTKKKILTSFFILFLILTLWSDVVYSTGTPVVYPGTDPDAVKLGAVRYREFATENNNNIFLGVPDLDDATRRTQTDLTWGTSNTISFAYDAILDKLTTTVNNGSTGWTLEYTNFSTSVRDLVFAGDQTAANNALSSLNYMQIDTTLREGSPAQLSLDDVYLDGNLLGTGSFPGVFHGTQSWHVSNYDFSAGFTLTGVLYLSGISSPSVELNKVEISFGYVDVDPFAPLTSNVFASPNPIALGGNVTLNATIDDSSTGSSNIQSAEYKLGSGAWTAMNAQDGTFDSPTENVTAAFTAPASFGGHALCVRGTDTAALTSVEECITLVVDDQGPLTSTVAVVPIVVSPGVNVNLTATVDDSTTGGSGIQSAEYNLDGGAWTAMVAQDGTFDSPTEGVSASFLSPLTAGAKNVCVRGTDTLANIGSQSCITLTVDGQGPLTTFLVASPDPVEPGVQVTLSATIDDTTTGNTNIQSAEYQLDSGAWTPMSAQDSGFDSPSEGVTAQFSAPAQEGTVEICARGSDALVNMGSTTCIQLTVSSSASPPPPLYLPILIKD